MDHKERTHFAKACMSKAIVSKSSSKRKSTTAVPFVLLLLQLYQLVTRSGRSHFSQLFLVSLQGKAHTISVSAAMNAACLNTRKQDAQRLKASRTTNFWSQHAHRLTEHVLPSLISSSCTILVTVYQTAAFRPFMMDHSPDASNECHFSISKFSSRSPAKTQLRCLHGQIC